MYRDEETVPPIVSEELWEKVNRILAERSEKQRSDGKTSYQNRYPYSGKIICGIHRTSYYRSIYRYKTGNKEVWQCQEYVKKGKSGCSSPKLYTYEADDVVRSLLEEFLDRDDIVQELIRIYDGIGAGAKAEEGIVRCKAGMEDIFRRKDKLLDLTVDGCITEAEFQMRNERFNSELEKLQARLKELEGERSKDREPFPSVGTLRRAIREELDFPNGFSLGVIDAFVERMEVCGTSDKNQVRVEVWLKGGCDRRNYLIRRKYSKPSVCTGRST